MKTGRLLKFDRPGATLHAYFFREGGRCRAAVYVSGGGVPDTAAAHEFDGRDEGELEERVRSWIDEHYPRSG